MVPSAIEGKALFEALYALGILAVSILVAWIMRWVPGKLLAAWAARTKTTLDDLILQAVRPPLVAFVVVQGIFVALTAVSYLDGWQDTINKAWVAMVVAIIFWGIQKTVAALLTWYGREMATRTRTDWDQRALPVLRRVLDFAILTIGALVILERVGISISPILAGLGIGGLAVALALQPTLSSFISGTYILSDGSIRPGDFIEIQGGPMGSVTEVGWRTTRVLTPENNAVTIPNSKLADSVVINYNQPSPAVNVVLSCGVSYESDLRKVEQICLEVMRNIREKLPEADKTFEPLVLYREFGDSNITFLLIMRAMDRGASFLVHHELTKAIHSRFTEEGIEINYPVRKLMYAEDKQSLKTPSPETRSRRQG